MSILEVAAFKSINLALQVCEGVADLSPATYLEKNLHAGWPQKSEALVW